MLKDFKAFILRGNVVDLAVGIIIGVAFGAIVASFVNDILMPPIGLGLGNIDFANMMVVLKEGATIPAPYESLAAAKDAGATVIAYGVFINTIINFLIIAAVVFFFVVRPIAHMYARRKAAEAPPPATTKDCPYCFTAIPIKATRCPNCTSELK